MLTSARTFMDSEAPGLRHANSEATCVVPAPEDRRQFVPLVILGAKNRRAIHSMKHCLPSEQEECDVLTLVLDKQSQPIQLSEFKAPTLISKILVRTILEGSTIASLNFEQRLEFNEGDIGQVSWFYKAVQNLVTPERIEEAVHATWDVWTQPRLATKALSSCASLISHAQRSSMSQQTVERTLFSFSTAVAACESSSDWERAVRLLHLASEERLRPGLVCRVCN
eukprot:Skav204288  [mRNA]  locus=scaffold409:342279:361269:- [translate_table: standard]